MRPATLVFRLMGVFVLALACAGLALAQVNTANLTGRVSDPTGAVVPGAQITVRNIATGAVRMHNSDAEGNFQFIGLPPGRYELTIEATGFDKIVAPELVLTIGQEAVFNANLQVQAGKTVVTVDATTEVIETTRTSVAQTVDQRRIENLPINGRNYINFTLTTSQAARDSAPSIGAAPTSGLNFGGQRARSNQVSVDGADATDNSVNGVRATVSQEAVQEFQLQVSNYNAEFGRATGGVVNIVTKRGANEIHGNVFGYLRHKSIQARNPFSVEVDAMGNATAVKQGYTRVQAGATIGGPIVEDKTFYFFSYETTRRQETGFTNIGANNFGLVPLPSGLEVTQDQAAFLATNPLMLPGAALNAIGALWGSASSVAINGVDPGLLNMTGMPLPVFPLPCTMGANPATACTLGATFLVNLPTSFKALSSLRGNYPISEGTSLWSGRLDHRWNDRNDSFVRLSVTPSTVTGIQVNAQNQNFGQNAGSRTSENQIRDVAVVAQHTVLWTDHLISEARFQFARRGLGYRFSHLPGGGDVAVNILGFAHFGREPFSTVDRIERRWQAAGNHTWILGRHTVKFGSDFNLIQLRGPSSKQIFELNFGGLYNFSSLDTLPLANALLGGLLPAGTQLPSISPVQAYGLGIPTVYVQGIGNSNRPFNNYAYAFFIQDSWKLTPRLTFNYGVRYDYEHTPIFPASTAVNEAAESALGVLEGIPRDTNNVAPRVALAWDPWGNGNTVIRAGYGLFYDHPLLAVAFNSTTAEGALSTQLISGGGNPSNISVGLNPLVLNATNIFQGLLNTTGVPLNFGYLPNEQRFDPKLMGSIFADQNFLTAGFPIPILPFTLHVDRQFEYGYAQQANLTWEQRIAKDYKFSVSYTYTHGLHLNRPRNITPTDPGLLVTNFANATAARLNPSSPLTVGIPSTFPSGPLMGMPIPAGTCLPTSASSSLRVDVPGALGTAFGAIANCTGTPTGLVATAAIFNFFRPTGPNPSFAGLFAAQGGYGFLTNLAGSVGFPMGPGVPIPWSDVVQQESTGNSIYHGLTVNFSKRFSKHFEFLSSWTWSHAIDDSTDLQTLLAPQDNNRPDLERSSSTFDQRHRWVVSAVMQSPYHYTDEGFWKKMFADFTVAPIWEVASGRPFAVLTGNDLNLDFGSNTDRPSVATSSSVVTATSPFIHGVTFALPDNCPVVIPGLTAVTGVGCTGTVGRNPFDRPGFVSLDLRISRRFYFNERWSLDVIADAFNLFNRFNVADVNPLCNPAATCNAGEPTAALDPRQFQFALKISW